MRIVFKLANGAPIPYPGTYEFKIVSTMLEYENDEQFLILIIELKEK